MIMNAFDTLLRGMKSSSSEAMVDAKIFRTFEALVAINVLLYW